MKTKSQFRKWGWAYDLDDQAPSALIFDDDVMLNFEPMNPTQRAKLTKFITMLNSRRFVPSTKTVTQSKAKP